MNARDILNDFDLKATSTAKTIAKIDWLSKLDTGGGVTLKLTHGLRSHAKGRKPLEAWGQHGHSVYLQEYFLVWGG